MSLPGLYLQKLTTNEPDESQLEVAIAAIEAVCDDNPVCTKIIRSEDCSAENPEEKERYKSSLQKRRFI